MEHDANSLDAFTTMAMTDQPKCPHCGETETEFDEHSQSKCWACESRVDGREQSFLCLTRQRNQLLAEAERLKKLHGQFIGEDLGILEQTESTISALRVARQEIEALKAEAKTFPWEIVGKHKCLVTKIESLRKERSELMERIRQAENTVAFQDGHMKDLEEALSLDQTDLRSQLASQQEAALSWHNITVNTLSETRSKLAAKTKECEKILEEINCFEIQLRKEAFEQLKMREVGEPVVGIEFVKTALPHVLDEYRSKCDRLEKELKEAKEELQNAELIRVGQVDASKSDLQTAIEDCNRSREIIYAMSNILQPEAGEHNVNVAKRRMSQLTEQAALVEKMRSFCGRAYNTEQFVTERGIANMLAIQKEAGELLELPPSTALAEHDKPLVAALELAVKMSSNWAWGNIAQGWRYIGDVDLSDETKNFRQPFPLAEMIEILTTTLAAHKERMK